MDETVTNELLERIGKLEAVNASIREEIKSKKEELASSDISITTSTLSLEHIEQDIEKSIRKNEIAYHNLRSNEESIKANVIEYTIDYSPFENLGQIEIIGDFTNMVHQPMNKRRETYFYSTILLKNFKYYYWMSDSEGQRVVDIEVPHEKHPKTGQICNFIDLGGENKVGALFDFRRQGNILNLQRKNLLMIKAGNWDEVAFLESLVIYANRYQLQFEAISKECQMKTNAIEQYIR